MVWQEKPILKGKEEVVDVTPDFVDQIKAQEQEEERGKRQS